MSMMKIAGSGSISQRYGSADPDPDSHQIPHPPPESSVEVGEGGRLAEHILWAAEQRPPFQHDVHLPVSVSSPCTLPGQSSIYLFKNVMVCRQAARLEIRRNFFSNRVVEEWNLVPKGIKKCEVCPELQESLQKSQSGNGGDRLIWTRGGTQPEAYGNPQLKTDSS